MRAGIWIVGASIFLSSMAEAQNLSQLEQSLESNGYHLYKPLRSNWGPGFVFSGDISGRGIGGPVEICPNVYADLTAPNQSKILLPNYKAEDRLSLRVALDYLKKITGFANDDADLARIEQQRTADITWGDIRELSYTDMDKYLLSGEPRPIQRRCQAAINDLKLRNRFEGRVFVISRSLATNQLIFDFSRALSVQAGVSANFIPRLTAGIQGRAELKDGTRLEVRDTFFVGYASPIAIKTWLPSGLVGDEIHEVKGEQSGLIIE
jgi:hypothetical protein